MTYIKTTYSDESELISSIMKLYNGGDMFELDPCYSKGVFYKSFETKPKYKFDLAPVLEGVNQADCTNLPINDRSIKSIMFDPPFVIGVGESKSSIITNRFSGFKSLKDLKTLYSQSLLEFGRVLVPNGLLVFKCQDTVTSGKQFMTHCWIINEAESLGYTLHDLFVLVRDRAIIDPKWKKQYHARKTHSYYLVFTFGNKNPSVNTASKD